MFDPLEHPGLPVDEHGRHWHELDVEPVDPRVTDPFTRSRINAMEAVETAAARFDRDFTWHCPDADARRSVGRLGQSASQRRHHITALQPSTVLRIPRTLFLKMLDSFPDSARKLRDILATNTDRSVGEIQGVGEMLNTPERK